MIDVIYSNLFVFVGIEMHSWCLNKLHIFFINFHICFLILKIKINKENEIFYDESRKKESLHHPHNLVTVVVCKF